MNHDIGPAPGRARHLFSVDVEEHFQVSAFDEILPRSGWDTQPSRVEPNTHRLLDLLARHGATGTFFTLGWVAERHPGLIRRIVAEGHELGSHSWWHERVNRQGPDRFREELHRSKGILEQLSGSPVLGFRAPSFSIVPGTEWAFDLLLDEGYTWDSSLFPIRRPGYGYPGATLIPHRLVRASGSLLEFPMTTWQAGPFRIPAAGGGYLRQFPTWLIHRAFRQQAARGAPGMFYIHPWEVDPGQPRLPVGPVTRFRHYRGLDRTMERLEGLCREFRFVSVARWLAEHPQ